jgi:hypothetical protein
MIFENCIGFVSRDQSYEKFIATYEKCKNEGENSTTTTTPPPITTEVETTTSLLTEEEGETFETTTATNVANEQETSPSDENLEDPVATTTQWPDEQEIPSYDDGSGNMTYV